MNPKVHLKNEFYTCILGVSKSLDLKVGSKKYNLVANILLEHLFSFTKLGSGWTEQLSKNKINLQSGGRPTD